MKHVFPLLLPIVLNKMVMNVIGVPIDFILDKLAPMKVLTFHLVKCIMALTLINAVNVMLILI